MKKRIFLFILIFLLLSQVMYCILLISFGLPMYWLPPLHRDKQVGLEELLIKPEDLSGQWVIQYDPFYDDDYSWSKYHEDNLEYSLNNITETEFLFHEIIRNWNIPVAEFRYNEIYKDAKHVFGSDSDYNKIIKIGNVQQLGDRSDIICFESIHILRTHCMIFSRIDEYVLRINFGVDGSVISKKDLEQKVNFYSHLAYSKFVDEGLVVEE
jgi:hypothetical protein